MEHTKHEAKYVHLYLRSTTSQISLSQLELPATTLSPTAAKQTNRILRQNIKQQPDQQITPRPGHSTAKLLSLSLRPQALKYRNHDTLKLYNYTVPRTLPDNIILNIHQFTFLTLHRTPMTSRTLPKFTVKQRSQIINKINCCSKHQHL